MKRALVLFGISLLSFGAFAQNSGDFVSFGNELLEQKNTVEIFPNPSVDFLNVRISNSDLEKTEFFVYSIIGSKYKVEVETTDNLEYRIDVRDLPPGYYLLSIKDQKNNFSKTFKFLKR